MSASGVVSLVWYFGVLWVWLGFERVIWQVHYRIGSTMSVYGWVGYEWYTVRDWVGNGRLGPYTQNILSFILHVLLRKSSGARTYLVTNMERNGIRSLILKVFTQLLKILLSNASMVNAPLFPAHQTALQQSPQLSVEEWMGNTPLYITPNIKPRPSQDTSLRKPADSPRSPLA